MEPDEIADDMFSMVGTEGQAAILDIGMPGWLNWAESAMNDKSFPSYTSMIGSMGLPDHLLMATEEIWGEGYDQLCEAWEGARARSALLNAATGGIRGFFEALFD